jgi:hypothetical protein
MVLGENLEEKETWKKEMASPKTESQVLGDYPESKIQ